MMERGVVVRYDADKGFGFVRSPAYGDSDVFVHATAIVGGGALSPGQVVRLTAESTPKGPRAVRLEAGRRGLSPAMLGVLALATVLIGGTIGLVAYDRIAPVWAWLATINAVTFALYAWDKRRSKNGGRRVPERVLLALALAGGTIGALLAMLALRHKTRKVGFVVPFVAVVAMQIAGLVWWFGAPR